jgi:hypothetical protein
VSRLPPASELATARRITLTADAAGSVAAIMAKLPDPAELAPATLVLVSGQLGGPKTLARSMLAAIGRTKPVARALRCSALVARGYVRVGAAPDASKDDIAWGYVPPCNSDDATEPG